jgi:hypothetical protein
MAPKNKQSDSEKLTRIALVSDDKVSSSERSGPFAPADNWFYHSASRRNGKSTCHRGLPQELMFVSIQSSRM